MSYDPRPQPYNYGQQSPQQQPYHPPQPPQYYPPQQQPYYPPQQQPYYPPQQQPYYPPQQIIVAAPSTSGIATASLVFGIIGALGGFCLFGIPCILAFILGMFGLAATKDGTRGGRGQAVAGLILGGLFVIPAVLVIVFGGIGAVIGAVDPSATPTP
jgi:hypothetical protein